jgi:hypothetical protein
MMEAVRPYGGRRRDSYMMALQRGWFVEILYYAGIQALDIPEVLENVDPGLLLENGSYVANHIMRMVSANVARLSQAKADWSVVPNTPDQEDQNGAQYAQHLLDYLYDYLDIERLRTMRNLWLEVTGTCFTYHNWSDQKGEAHKVYFDPMTQQPMDANQLQPDHRTFLDSLGASTEIQDGDFEYEILSPFQVYFPPRFTEVKKMPWMLIRRIMSLDEVWDRWPDVAPEITPDDTNMLLTGHFWGRLPTLAHRPGLGLSGHSDNDDAVVVDELWVPPSKRMPGGLTTFMVKRHMLERGPHKLAAAGLTRRFPVTDWRNILVPGRFHGMGTVEHLIGPQRDYNRGRQQIIQQRDVLATPQWLVPKGSLVKKIVRNEYGDWIEYNPIAGTPTLQNPPALSELHMASINQAKEDMQTIASQSEASLGMNPTGVRSGNAVMMLQEKDQLGVGPTVSGLERSTEIEGEALLELGWKFMSVPRAIKVYGQSRQSDVKYFKGQDIRGNTSVRVRAGSMMPKSKSQTFELVSKLIELGALNVMDPREKRLILETLDVGGTDRLFFLEDAARRRARIENMMFARPDPRPDFAFPDVSVFDDHQAHWEEHLEFTYTDEYELLPPLRKLALQAHMQKHAAAVGQAMQAAQMVAGAGGAGGPSQSKQPGQASQPRDRQPTPGSAAASNL